MKGVRKNFFAQLAALISCAVLMWPIQALPMPTGGDVVAGQATISQPNATTMQINQQTQKAIINWQGYSINANELVRYVQPGASAIVLNRVIGGDPSLIYGQIQANGQVFVINNAGILVGAGAKIDVGSFLASTLNISDSDFLAGKYNFVQDSGKNPSYIVNKGTISVSDEGYVILAAPLVSNEGLIIANLGKVNLIGGEKVAINFDGTGLINFTVENLPGQPGTVLMTREAVSDVIKNVVNTKGLVEAGSVVEKDGVIELVGASGVVVNSGTIKAQGGSAILKATQAVAHTATGKIEAAGGSFEISGKNFLLQGSTVASRGLIDPTNLYVLPGSGTPGPNEVYEAYIEAQSQAGTAMTYQADDLISITDLSIGSDGRIDGGSGDITFQITDDGDNAGVISFANNANEIRTTTGMIRLDARTNATDGQLQNIGKLTTTDGGNIVLEAGKGIALANDISLNTSSGTGTLTVISNAGTIEQLQASDIDSNGADITFSAPAVSLNGTITTDNGNITFNNLATGFEINAPAGQVNAGTGNVNILTAAGTTIDLGFVGTSNLKISDNTLDNIITTGTLNIGDATTGNIYIGAVSQGSTDVVITSGGSILDDGTIGTAIGAQTLTLVAQSVGTADSPVGINVTTGNISVDTTSGGVAGNVYLIEPANELDFSKLTFTTDPGSIQTISLAGVAGIDVDDATTITDNLILVSDTVNIGSTITGGSTNYIIIKPYSDGKQIDLGTESTGQLSITNDELNNLQSVAAVQIGDTNAGNLTVSAAITPTGTNTLILVAGDAAGENITGTGTITVANLGLSASGSITLNNIDADTLAAISRVSGDITITDVDDLVIGQVSGAGTTITGVTTTASDIDIRSADTLTIAADVQAGSGGNIILYGGTDGTGDVALGANVKSLGAVPGDIHIKAGNAITRTAGTVTGDQVFLDAVDNVGTTTAPIITYAATLGGQVTSSGGGFFVDQAGDLIIGQVQDLVGSATFNGISTSAGNVRVRLTDDAAILTIANGLGVDTIRTLGTGSGVGDVILVADQMIINTDAVDQAINAGSAYVYLYPYTTGTTVDIGAAGSYYLKLSDSELDEITAGLLVIGNSTTGSIEISNDVSPDNVNAISLISGADIVSNGGRLTENSIYLYANSNIGEGITDRLLLSADTIILADSINGNIYIDNNASVYALLTANNGLIDIDVTGAGNSLATSGDWSANEIIAQAAGNISLFHNITADAGNILITSTGGTITLTSGDTVDTSAGNGNITFKANDVNIQGIITAGTGVVNFIPNAGVAITVGAGSANFGVSNAELDAVQSASRIEIGDANSGAVTIDGAVNPANVDTLVINTGSTIDDNGGSNVITVDTLALIAGTGIGTTNVVEIDANTLAAKVIAVGNIVINEQTDVTIGDVDTNAGTISGLGTFDGSITLTTNNGTIIVSSPIVAGDDSGGDTWNITLTATNSGNTANIEIGADITADNNVYLTAGDAITRPNTGLITGNLIELDAGTGIGAFGSAIYTEAATLTARTTTSGGIYIYEQSAVDIGTGSTFNGIIAAGGDIVVANASGDMTVSQSVTTSGTGTITLVVEGEGNTFIHTNNSIDTDDQNITIIADRIDLQGGTIGSNNETVLLVPNSLGTTITLGVATDDDFSLSDAELNTINVLGGSGILRIGDTNAGDITISGNIDVSGDADILHLTSAGNITSSGGVITANDLALTSANAGNIDVDTIVNTVAAITNSGNITIEQQGSNNLIVGTVDGVVGITAGGSDVNVFTVDGSITVDDNIYAAGTGTITITSGDSNYSDGIGASVLTNNAVISTSNGSITLVADRMTLDGDIDSAIIAGGTNVVTLKQYATTTSGAGTILIDLGGLDAFTPGAPDSVTLGLTGPELDTITASQLTIGATNGANIDNTDAISLNSTKVPTLLLVTGGAIDNTGTGSIEVENLALSAVDGIGMTWQIYTNVTNLAAYNASSNDININEIASGGDLNIGSVAGIDGITNNSIGGDIYVWTNDGTLNVNQPVAADGVVYLGAFTIVNTANANIYNDVSAGGDVVIQADNDINISSGIISAGGTIYLFADYDTDAAGAIDQTGGQVGLGAEDLVLYAAEGITITNAQVVALNALNTTSGDIEIINTGDLTIDDFFHGIGWGVRNVAGGVYITNTGSIDIPGTSGFGVWAEGNVEVTATVDITAGSDNTITAFESNSGNVVLNADQDIILGQGNFADVYTSSGSGSITITAGRDVIIDDSTWINSDNGDIAITAGRDFQLLATNTGGAWVGASDDDLDNVTGNVLIIAQTGGITVDSGTDGITSDYGTVTLIADAMDLQSTIGNTTEDVFIMPYTAGTPIDLGVNTPGAITGALELDDAELDNVVSTGTLVIGTDGTDVNAGAIYITDDITPAGVSSLALITTGEIDDGTSGLGGNKISIQRLTFDAGSFADITTEVDDVAGIAAGYIRIDEDSDITVVNTGWNGIIGLTTTGSDITLITIDGDIIVNANITAGNSGNILLVAGDTTPLNDGVSRQIQNNADILSQGDGGNITLQAQAIDLTSGSTITTAAGVVTLIPFKAGTLIDLDGSDVADNTGTADTLGLTHNELETISTGNGVVIGDTNTGTITLTSDVGPNTNFNNLALITGANITDDGSAPVLSVNNNLTLDSATGIGGSSGFTGTAFEVNSTTLAARTRNSGNIIIADIDGFTVDSAINASSAFDGVYTSSNGNISLQTGPGGVLTIEEPVTADGSGNIDLIAGLWLPGDIVVNDVVSSTSGVIMLWAGTNIDVNDNITTGGTGTITLITLTGDITQDNGTISTTGTGGIDIWAGQDFIQTSPAGINSGDFVTIAAGRDITIDPVTATSFIDLRAGDDVIITGNLTATNSHIYIRANNDGALANDGDSGVYAGGNVIFDGTGGAITIKADDADGNLDGVILVLGENIYALGNNAGDVTFWVDGTVAGDGNVINQEFSLAFLAEENIGSATNPVLITATGNGGHMAGSFVAIADASLDQIDPNIGIFDGFSHDADNPLIGTHLPFANGVGPDGVGQVYMSANSIINSGQDITIIAPDEIVLDQATYTAPGDIYVESTGSSVTVNQGVDLTAGTDGVSETSGTITLRGETDVIITGGTSTNSSNLTAEDSIYIIADTGDVYIGEYTNITSGTIMAFVDPQWPQNIVITSTNGSIYFTGSQGNINFDTYGSILLTAANDITLGTGATIPNSNQRARFGDIIYTATNGEINTELASLLTGIGDIELYAGDSVSINGTITPAGYFEVEVGRDLAGADGAFILGENGVLNLSGNLVIGPNVSGNNIAIFDSVGSGNDVVVLNGEVLTGPTGSVIADLDTANIAGKIVVGGVINAGDNVTIIAESSSQNSIIGGGNIAGDEITIRGHDIEIGNINANRWIYVSAGDDIKTGSLTAMQNASSGYAIKLETLGGEVEVNGPITANATSGLNVAIDPYDVVINSPVNVTGNFDVWATNDIEVYADITSTGGNIRLYANSTDLTPTAEDTFGDFVAGSGVDIKATNGNISITGVNVTLRNLNAGGAIDVVSDFATSPSGGVLSLYGNITGVGGITFTGQNNILDAVLNNNVNLATTNALVSFNTDNLDGAYALGISTGSGNVILGVIGQNTPVASLDVNTTGTATLNGDIETTGNLDLSGVGTISIGNNITLITSNGDIRINGTSGVSGGAYDLTLVSTSGNLHIGTIGGGITGFNASTGANAYLYGDITTASGGTGINMNGVGTIILNNNIIMTSNNADINLGSSDSTNITQSGNRTLSLNAGTGNIYLDNVNISTLNLTAGANTLYGNISVDNPVNFANAGNTTLGADVTVTTSNDAVTFAAIDGPQNLTINTGTGALTLGAVGQTTPLSSLTTNSGTIDFGGDVTVNNGILITTPGNVVADYNITSNNGNIKLDIGGSLTVNSGITIASGGYLDIDPTNLTNAGTLNADDYITITLTGTLTNTGTISTNLANSYIVISAGSIVQNGDITTPTGGNEYVTLTATGAITDVDDAATNITTQTLNILGASSIGGSALDAELDTDVANLYVTGVTGNTYIYEADAVTVTGVDVGGSFTLTANTVSTTGAITSSSGLVTVNAPITLGANIFGGAGVDLDNVTLSASSIIINGGSGSVITGTINGTTGTEDLTITAANTVTFGAIGGTVDIGDLLVNAGTINVNGNVDSADTITLTGNINLAGDLTADAGNIELNGNTTLAGGARTLTANAAGADILVNGDISGAQNLTLTANDVISLQTVGMLGADPTLLDVNATTALLSGDIAVNGNIDFAGVTGGTTLLTNVAMNAWNGYIDLSGSAVNGGYSLSATATGDITTADIGTTSPLTAVTLISGDDIVVGAVNTSGNLSMQALNTITTTDAINAGGNVIGQTITSAITIGDDINANGTITLVSGEDLILANGVDLSSATQIVLVSGLAAGEDITIAGDVNAPSVIVNSGLGVVNIAGGPGIRSNNLGSTEISGAGLNLNRSFTSQVNLLVNAPVTVTRNNLALTSNTGNITLNADISSDAATNRNFTLNAMNGTVTLATVGAGTNDLTSLTVNAANAVLNGNIEVDGNVTMTNIAGAITLGNDITIDASGGTASVISLNNLAGSHTLNIVQGNDDSVVLGAVSQLTGLTVASPATMTFNGVVNIPGNITVTATTTNVNADVTSAGLITINGDTNLGANITGQGTLDLDNLILTANSQITSVNGNITIGGDLSGAYTLIAQATSGSVDFNTIGAAAGTTDDPTGLIVNAKDVNFNGDAWVNGAVNVNASRDITINADLVNSNNAGTITLTAGNDVLIANTADASVQTINGLLLIQAKNVYVGDTANNNIAVIETTGTGNIKITASGNVVMNNADDTSIISGGNINIDPVVVTIAGAGLSAVGDITVNATQLINVGADVTADSDSDGTGNVVLASGNIVNQSVGTISGENVTISALDANVGPVIADRDNSGNGWIQINVNNLLNINDTLSAGDYINLVSTSGSIYQYSGDMLAGGNVTLYAADNITIGGTIGSTTAIGGDVVMNGPNAVTVGGTDYYTVGGNVNINGAVEAEGQIYAGANGFVNVQSTVTSNNSDINLVAGSGIITTDELNAGLDINLLTAGLVDVADLVAGNNILINALGNVGNMGTMTAGANIEIYGANIEVSSLDADGYIYVQATGNADIGDAVAETNSSAGYAIKITAKGAVDVSDLVATANPDLNISVDPTSVTVSGPITATGNVDISAENFISVEADITADSDIDGAGNATLVTVAGPITMAAGTTISGENVNFTAGGAMALAIVTAGDTITGIAGTDITLTNDLTADNDIILTSTSGSIGQTGGLVSATNFIVTAENGIGTLTNPIQTDIDNLTAQSDGGVISIGNATDLTVALADNPGNPVQIVANGTLTIAGDITGSDVTLESTIADIIQTGGTLTSTGVATLEAVDGINLTATELNKLTANVSGTGDITIIEATDIELTSVVTNNGDIVIQTSNGTITAVNVNAGGTDGDVILTASGATKDIMITGTGITATDDVILTSADQITGGMITADQLSVIASGTVNIQTTVNTFEATTANANISVVEAANLNLNNINAGTGDVSITVLSGTLTSNTGTSITANDLTIIGDGAVLINTDVDTLAASTNDADVTVNEVDGLALNLVNAGTGDIQIILAAGAITDNNGSALNMAGDEVILVAVEGIGSSDALETMVNSLDATNINNNIEIANNGALQLIDLDGDSYSTVNTNGAVIISAASPITVGSDVLAGGNITLTAGEIEDAGIWADDLLVNANITSTNGYVLLRAGDDITLGSSYTVQTQATGQIITLIAGYQDQDNAGAINSAGTLLTNNGDINLSSYGNTTVATVNAGTGDVTIASTTGSVSGGKITADLLTIDSKAGINIATNVNTLDAYVSGDGDITVVEDNAITLIDVKTYDGFISVTTTNGTITATDVVAGDADGNESHDVTLIANGTGSDVLVGFIYADNEAILTANDTIVQNPVDANVDVVALGLVASAGTGNIDLDTNVNNLTASAGTNIVINEQDDLSVVGSGVVSTTGGVININANSSIMLDANVTTTGDVVLVADNDGDGVGSIVRTAGTVSGDDLILRAGSGIGSALAPIVTAVATVDAVNTASGEIGINDAGTLTVVQAINTGRPVTITSGSAMTITGDITGSYVTLESTTANINQTGGLVTSTILATLDAATGINLNNTEFNKLDASVSGAGAISIGELTDIELTDVDTADGDIVITTTNGTITVVDVNAGGADGDVLLTTNGSVSGIIVTSNGITAGEDVTLDSDGYISVVNSSISADGFVNMQADNGNVDITGSNIVANNEYISISSPMSVNITGASELAANTDVDIYGDDYVGIVGSSIEALGNITLESSWNLNIVGSVINATNGSISILAENDITIDTTDIYAGNNIEIDAGWNLAIDSSYIESYGEYITIYADNNIGITNSDINADYGYLDITADYNVDISGTWTYSAGDTYIYSNYGNIAIATSDIEAHRYLDIEAGYNVSIADSYLFGYDDSYIYGLYGDVTITGSVIYSGYDLDIYAGSNVNISDSSLYSYDTTWIYAGISIGITSSDIYADYGYLDIDADYNVSIADSYLYGYDDIYIYGWDGNVTITESEIYSDNVIDIYAGNNVEITSSYLESYDDTYIYADNKITIGATDIYAGYNLEIDAGWNVAIDSSYLESYNDTYITAGNDINITTTSLVNAGANAELEAGGNITVGVIAAVDSVTMDAGGAIIDNNGDATNIITPTLTMNAANGIGTLTDPIETQVQTLTAVNSTANDIVITNNRDTTGNLTILSAVNTGGSVIIRNGDIQNGTNGGAIFLGQPAISGPTVVAQGSVELYATQEIVDRNNEGDENTNDPATIDIVAGRDSVLYSEYGWIGEPNNPIEINIDGEYPQGHLYVYAGGLDPYTLKTSVNLAGYIIPYGIPEAFNGLVPPGLILFNYRVVGGSGDDGGLLPPGFLWAGPGIELINYWNTSIAQNNIGIANEPGYFGRIMQKVLFETWFEPEEAPYIIDEALRQIIEGIVLVK